MMIDLRPGDRPTEWAPASPLGVCPTCGRCQTCGHPAPSPYPVITWSGTSGAPGRITD